MSDLTITGARVIDLRFPTSREAIGSDAVNKDPDYSAAYCVLETNSELRGYGITFTLGRGTDLVVRAVEYLARFAVGRTLDSITQNFVGFFREVTGDTQYRWLGPEKGVVHLAAAALLNAVWDLWARVQKKPLWKLLAEMPAEQLMSAIDFRYITDALPPEEALEMLRERTPGMAKRIATLERDGYPA